MQRPLNDPRREISAILAMARSARSVRPARSACTIEADERTGLDRSRAALDVVNRCISPAEPRHQGFRT